MSNKYCCEEMEMFVQAVNEVVADTEGAATLGLSFEGDAPDELIIRNDPRDKDFYIPNVIFRFCPYCGRMLTASRELTTDDDFLRGVCQLLKQPELASGRGPRRQGALEEFVDQVQALAERAISDSVASGGKKVVLRA